MTKLLITVAAVSLCLGLAACSKDDAAGKAKSTTTKADEQKAAAGGHAAADVVPGSHEDWCDEHGVPESQCTRCNAELTAAFKATGDWCEEHGLPESQCLKCNPEARIVRPPPSAPAETKE